MQTKYSSNTTAKGKAVAGLTRRTPGRRIASKTLTSRVSGDSLANPVTGPAANAGASSFEIGITPEIHKDGDWYVAFCPEVPEANGQGRTPEESVKSLKDGVLSIMQDQRQDASNHVKSGLPRAKPA